MILQCIVHVPQAIRLTVLKTIHLLNRKAQYLQYLEVLGKNVGKLQALNPVG